MSFVNIILPRAEVPLGLELAVFDGDALAEAAKASKRSLLEEWPTREDTEVMGGEGSSICRATVSQPEITKLSYFKIFNVFREITRFAKTV